ncbi:MAG: hypothetical protein AAGH83_10165 [Pseudomonadota bacterium]
MKAPGPGHNGGPTLEPGVGWRRYCWRKARADLLPQLPLEVVRIRVARAKALGLPYRTYATVRATAGQDIVAFMFSSNALNLLRETDTLAADRSEVLAGLTACGRLMAAQPPLDPETVGARMRPFIDSCRAAPAISITWSGLARWSGEWLSSQSLSRRGVLVVGETALEREWSVAGRMAGFLRGGPYFDAAATPA